jgi:pyridoxal phosphate enzyme (YggS family)
MAINRDVIQSLDKLCRIYGAKWVAVTKNQSIATLNELYGDGIAVFGENKAQELLDKYEKLPRDIEWHFIGHLQSNKVKAIIDKVAYIHAVDSLKLLQVIQKEALAIPKTINVFIQVHVASEEAKFGFSLSELQNFFDTLRMEEYPNVKIIGLMAMASNTRDTEKIRAEFQLVKSAMDAINATKKIQLTEISMGMSGDYEIALECGATILRIGSLLYN